MKALALSALLAAAATSAFASQLEGPAAEAGRVSSPQVTAAPQLPVQLSLDFSALPPVDGGRAPLAPVLPSAPEAARSATQASPALTRPAAPASAAATPETAARILPFARAHTPPAAGARSASAARTLEKQAPLAAALNEKASEISGEDAATRAGALFGEFSAKRAAGPEAVSGRESAGFRSLRPFSVRRGAANSAAAPRKPKRSLVRKLVFWNIVAYLLTQPLMPAAGAIFGAVPSHMRAVFLRLSPLGLLHAAATSFTYMFIHANAAHLIGNMTALLLFGPLVERWIGRSSFKKVYFGSGLAAALAGAALIYGPPEAIIGASTAIFGVIGAYLAALLLLRPWAKPRDSRWWKRPLALAKNAAIVLIGAFGAMEIAQNLWLLFAVGPLAHGVYVLGHVVGAVVGFDLATLLLRRAKAPDAS